LSNMMTASRPKFSVAIQTDGYKKLINNTLQDPKRAQRFVASVSSMVATTPALQECDAGTILTGALLGEALNLTPSPQLGQYYLVPFNNKIKLPDDTYEEHKVATFVLGYKGYIQLALRTGQYRKINVMSVKKGELISFDPFNEEISLNPIFDPIEREAAETVGYYAMFEYINGFRKVIYWSREKMISHADRYSAAFNSGATKGRHPKYDKVSFADYQTGNYPKGSEWLYSSFWYKDFDGMAHKTLLRQLISKWGIMSTELQQAFEADGQLVRQDGTVEMVDTAMPDMHAMEALPPQAAIEVGQASAIAAESAPAGQQSAMSLNDV
jgi:recombinase, phage RecT family